MSLHVLLQASVLSLYRDKGHRWIIDRCCTSIFNLSLSVCSILGGFKLTTSSCQVLAVGNEIFLNFMVLIVGGWKILCTTIYWDCV